jgi:hypothetical protein
MLRDWWGELTRASDFANPSLYYGRAKCSSAIENVRWCGNSVIERAEFPVTVVSTTPPSGEWRSITTGDGATIGLNLWSKDLTYTGDEGVGFEDLLSVGLRYDYGQSATADATGILGAAGWSTNFDERIVAGTKAGAYTYQDPSGNRTGLSTNADGQIVGGSVDIARPRAPPRRPRRRPPGRPPGGVSAPELVRRAGVARSCQPPARAEATASR